MCKTCNRRIFLKAGGIALFSAASGSLGGGPLFLGRAAWAAPEPGPFRRRKVLVALFQRGAMDGLMAVPPLDEAALRRLRPRLAMSAAHAAGEEALLDLDGSFGLHPAFAPLLPLWRDRRLAVVHAVGSPDPTRSHFDAQDYMESGTPGNKATASGWLDRVAGELGHEPASPFRAVSMTAALPRSLYGRVPAVAVAELADLRISLPGAADVASSAGAGFESLYQATTEDLLRHAGKEAFAAVELLRKAGLEGYRPASGVRYPPSPLGDALRQIAFLVKSDLGLEVAFAESGGWDTHVQQGTVRGAFARRADDLAKAVAAFWQDLGTYQDDVVLLTMTEFGRTAAENGSGGTDHGHGSCLFVLGSHVQGGRVHGEFPGLAPEALHEGRDLPVTTDFRAVFAGLAGEHLRVADPAALFPGWKGRPLPLVAT